MAIYQSHIGLNFSSSRLQLVEVDCDNNNFYIGNIDEEYFSEFLDIKSKETKIISILQHAFDELILRKPLGTDNISFTLPHEFFRTIEIPVEDTLLSEDLLEFYKWNFSILFPHENPEDFIIQPIDINSAILKKEKRAILLAVERKFLKIIYKFCSRNNLHLRYVDNVHLATTPLIVLESQPAEDEITLSLHVSEKSLSMLLLDKNNPGIFDIRNFATATAMIECLKQQKRILERHNLSAENITKIFIAGENVSEGIIKQVTEIFGVEPIKYNPFGKIKPSPEIQENEFLTDRNNAFASAAGISLRLI